MLRVKGETAPPMPSQDEATDEPEVMDNPAEEAAEPKPEDQPMGKFTADKVDPAISGYMASDLGPFECQRCAFWEAPNACAVVMGNIDPRGCCNLFTPMDAGQEAPPTEKPTPAETAPEVTPPPAEAQDVQPV